MQANISLIFNLLLLAGVVYAILRILRKQPTTEASEMDSANHTDKERDDIIAVRKIPPQENVIPTDKVQAEGSSLSSKPNAHPQLFFLVPNKQSQFQGYDLLQSLLSAKLRFGEGNFFHFYQQQNGITESVFTVTATSETGEFDLKQMHSFSTRGLCLFTEAKANESKNEAAKTLLLDTANRLCDLLDATLLDEAQKPMRQTKSRSSKETAMVI